MSSKKNFKGNNPAMQFISAEQTLQAEQTSNMSHADKTDKTQYTDTADNTYKTGNIEIKNRRVNWLLFPSVFEDLKKIAIMKQTTINDLVNKILKDYNAREAETIAQYDTVFKE
jgi:hypothetical protein